MRSCLGVCCREANQTSSTNSRDDVPSELCGGGKCKSTRAERLLDPNGPRLFLWVLRKPFKGMAGTTGLEPAASAVTGQRSNQLNYVPTRQINEMPNRQCL